jgi:hypothetical protein
MKTTFTIMMMTLLVASRASANDDLNNLQAMYMLSASQSLCAFPMSLAEKAKLDKAAEFLEAKLSYDAAKAAAYFSQVKAAVEAQKAQLCKADGEWSKTYTAALAGLPE